MRTIVMPKSRLVRYVLGVAMVVAGALSLALWRLGVAPIYAGLVAVNVVTLLLYGFDKRQAIKGGTRVPEVVLHAAALPAGSPGVLLGQRLFRHKTRKLRFQIVFIATVLLQIAAAWAYWHFVRS